MLFSTRLRNRGKQYVGRSIPSLFPNASQTLRRRLREISALVGLSWNKDDGDDDQVDLMSLNNDKSTGESSRGPASIDSTARSQHRRVGRLQGWRFGVLCSAAASATVLLINLILLIVALGKGIRDSSGLYTVYAGKCTTINDASIASHILINTLSTILLSASNYTMQLLASPTRDDLDRAHTRGDWLHIGIPSFHNIRGRVSRKRTLMWWVLGISSLPIHFLYNAAVVQTIRTSIYDVGTAGPKFLEGRPPESYANFRGQLADFNKNFGGEGREVEVQMSQMWSSWQTMSRGVSHPHESNVEVLQNAECIKAYGQRIVTGRGPVLLISRDLGNYSNVGFIEVYSESTGVSNMIGGMTVEQPYLWLCPDRGRRPCDTERLREDSENWTIDTPYWVPSIDTEPFRVDYCLSMVVDEPCKLQVSPVIIALVMGCNLVKALVMLLLLITVFRGKRPLATIGDAIESFLCRPAHTASYGATIPAESVGRKTNEVRLFLRRRWFQAASIRRWVVVVTVSLMGAGTAAAFLNHAVAHTESPFSRAFGALDLSTIVITGVDGGLPTVGSAGFFVHVLLVNLPQVIFSLIYFLYNGLVTSMLAAKEWNDYYLRKRPLRVSDPYCGSGSEQAQRSTYFLSLPYRYCLPLMIASGTLHWLISQSLFLVRLEGVQYDPSALSTSPGKPLMEFSGDSQAGYSCPPMLAGVLLSFTMVAGLIALGFCTLPGPMPIVVSNSLAISAACRRPDDDENAAYLPVSWGELPHDERGQCHCCFTSKDVTVPCSASSEEGSESSGD